jgi:hypothetical protein
MRFLVFALAVAITAPRVELYSLPAATAVSLATATLTWRHINAPAHASVGPTGTRSRQFPARWLNRAVSLLILKLGIEITR